MNSWTNFFTVVVVQLIVLLFVAYKKGAVRSITPKFLMQSAGLGLVFGVVFDMVFGKYLHVFSYVLGFDLPFLVTNGALSYGLFIATILLLRSERFLFLCLWTGAVALVYEVANKLFTVWTWNFAGGVWPQEVIVVLVGYCGLAILVASTASLTIGVKFRALK